jgi:hypothetical protein
VTDLSTDAPGTAAPADQCPKWAAALIAKIRDLEIRLGNIHPTGEEWQVQDLDGLYRRSAGMTQDDDEGEGPAFDSQVTQTLFIRVAQGLSDEGFDPATIAQFINSRVPTGGRLLYCNAAEVVEALTGQA